MPRKHLEVTIPTPWSRKPIRIAVDSALGLIVLVAFAIAAQAIWIWLI